MYNELFGVSELLLLMWIVEDYFPVSTCSLF